MQRSPTTPAHLRPLSTALTVAAEKDLVSEIGVLTRAHRECVANLDIIERGSAERAARRARGSTFSDARSLQESLTADNAALQKIFAEWRAASEVTAKAWARVDQAWKDREAAEAELSARRTALADEEERVAEDSSRSVVGVHPFAEQLALADRLSVYFGGLVASSGSIGGDAAAAASSAPRDLRSEKAKEADAEFADFMGGGGKKKKTAVRARAPAAPAILTLDFSTITALGELGLAPPSTLADVPSTVSAIAAARARLETAEAAHLNRGSNVRTFFGDGVVLTPPRAADLFICVQLPWAKAFLRCADVAARPREQKRTRESRAQSLAADADSSAARGGAEAASAGNSGDGGAVLSGAIACGSVPPSDDAASGAEPITALRAPPQPPRKRESQWAKGPPTVGK